MIFQELDFVYIAKGKKFLNKEEAEEYDKKKYKRLKKKKK